MTDASCLISRPASLLVCGRWKAYALTWRKHQKRSALLTRKAVRLSAARWQI